MRPPGYRKGDRSAEDIGVSTITGKVVSGIGAHEFPNLPDGGGDGLPSHTIKLYTLTDDDYKIISGGDDRSVPEEEWLEIISRSNQAGETLTDIDGAYEIKNQKVGKYLLYVGDKDNISQPPREKFWAKQMRPALVDTVGTTVPIQPFVMLKNPQWKAATEEPVPAEEVPKKAPKQKKIPLLKYEISEFIRYVGDTNKDDQARIDRILLAYDGLFGDSLENKEGDYSKAQGGDRNHLLFISAIIRNAFGFKPLDERSDKIQSNFLNSPKDDQGNPIVAPREWKMKLHIRENLPKPSGVYDTFGIPLPTELKTLTKEEVRKRQYESLKDNGELYQAFLLDINTQHAKIKRRVDIETVSPLTDMLPLQNDPRIGVADQGGCNGPCTPTMKIRWRDDNRDNIPDPDHGYFEYGASDPLGQYKEVKRVPLNSFMIRHFGMEFADYWKLNKDDITKQVIVKRADGQIDTGKVQPGSLKAGDIVIQSPNFWPIHVAMAHKEFAEKMRQGQGDKSEYESILYFEKEEDYEQAKKQAAAGGVRLDFQAQIIPANVRKVLSKRVTYMGVEDAPEVFAGVKYKDIFGLIDVAAENPIFGIGDSGRKNIRTARAYYGSSIGVGIDNHVRDPSGAKLYKNYIGGELKSISTSTDAPPGTNLVYDRSEPFTIGSTRESSFWHGSEEIDFEYGREERVGDKTEFVKDEEKSFVLGRAFVLPKGAWRGQAPDEITQPFTSAEKILAARLGVRLDQDYDMDLSTGKTNFVGLPNHKPTDDPEIDPEIISAEDLGMRGGTVGEPDNAAVDKLSDTIRSLFRLTKRFDPEDERSDILYYIPIEEIPLQGESDLVLQDLTKEQENEVVEKTGDSPSSGPVTIELITEATWTNFSIARNLAQEFERDYTNLTDYYYYKIQGQLEEIDLFEKKVYKKADQEPGTEPEPAAQEQPASAPSQSYISGNLKEIRPAETEEDRVAAENAMAELKMWESGSLKETDPKSWEVSAKYWEQVSEHPSKGKGATSYKEAAKYARAGLLYGISEELFTKATGNSFSYGKRDAEKPYGKRRWPKDKFTKELLTAFYNETLEKYDLKKLPYGDLQKYIDDFEGKPLNPDRNVPLGNGRNAQGPAWSAIFINYVMRDHKAFKEHAERGTRKQLGLMAHASYSGEARRGNNKLTSKNIDSIGYITLNQEQMKKIDYKPRVGDLVIDKNKHVDIVTPVGKIGGNLSNSVRVQYARADEYIMTNSREAKEKLLKLSWEERRYQRKKKDKLDENKISAGTIFDLIDQMLEEARS